ncbi:MAG: hypothetical protein A2987_03955 [Omnitrophica bacterium RIFCSPLOWO2_01_FULL_45_10]|nr:MAG: hypothetical protein A2987_03955 [Omnitrophica bacterium RIFCSPLOWO2_01_FULL_45_10]
MSVVIRIENLSKKYFLSHKKEAGYVTLRDCIAGNLRQISNKILHLFRRSGEDDIMREEFWALKDINLEVEKGDCVGIIGRNGAGKTTLLKITSRITEPTEGRVFLKGRVASLLGVGVGFHPELTGRENIYLNGAILGMKRREISSKFDEITSFAEIERFIDTPVKYYSSGMYVRLAFSVASQLSPDILLVDEVLSVGDAIFQNKCLDRIAGITKEGRTVLFVSHNLPSVANLCKKAILLEKGKIILYGKPADVIGRYLSTIHSKGGEMVWPDISQAPGSDIVRLHAVRIIQDGFECPTADVDISKDILIQISYWNLREGEILHPTIVLKDNLGTSVFSSSNHKSISLTYDEWSARPHPKGLFQSVCRIPADFLNEGRYTITAVLSRKIADTQAVSENVLSFQVHDTGAMRKEFISGGWEGVVRPRLEWKTEFLKP